MPPSSVKDLKSVKLQTQMSSSLFLEIVETINQATTLESLFESAMKAAPVCNGSYHHLPSIGASDYNTLGPRYYGYNLPEPILDHYENYDTSKKNPALLKVFQGCEPKWLSDLAADPSLADAEWETRAALAMNLLGDGLCIPLFGPNNRQGYMFVTLERNKKDISSYVVFQIQALAQHLHLRFCLMIKKLQKQIQLTDREAEVLELVTLGKTNPEIAIILNISASTVSGYLNSVFIKLDVSDRVSASLRALSMKVVF